MDIEEIEIEEKVRDLLDEEFSGDEIVFTGDGKHFALRIVSEKFAGKSRIERSRLVYAKLEELISSNELHALQMELKTSSEIK